MTFKLLPMWLDSNWKTALKLAVQEAMGRHPGFLYTWERRLLVGTVCAIGSIVKCVLACSVNIHWAGYIHYTVLRKNISVERWKTTYR